MGVWWYEERREAEVFNNNTVPVSRARLASLGLPTTIATSKTLSPLVSLERARAQIGGINTAMCSLPCSLQNWPLIELHTIPFTH